MALPKGPPIDRGWAWMVVAGKYNRGIDRVQYVHYGMTLNEYQCPPCNIEYDWKGVTVSQINCSSKHMEHISTIRQFQYSAIVIKKS